MMSFVATLLLGGIVQTAHAVEWYDVCVRTCDASHQKKQR